MRVLFVLLLLSFVNELAGAQCLQDIPILVEDDDVREFTLIATRDSDEDNAALIVHFRPRSNALYVFATKELDVPIHITPGLDCKPQQQQQPLLFNMEAVHLNSGEWYTLYIGNSARVFWFGSGWRYYLLNSVLPRIIFLHYALVVGLVPGIAALLLCISLETDLGDHWTEITRLMWGLATITTWIAPQSPPVVIVLAWSAVFTSAACIYQHELTDWEMRLIVLFSYPFALYNLCEASIVYQHRHELPCHTQPCAFHQWFDLLYCAVGLTVLLVYIPASFYKFPDKRAPAALEEALLKS